MGDITIERRENKERKKERKALFGPRIIAVTTKIRIIF